MERFDPFTWAQSVLLSGNEIKAILFAALIVFGLLIAADEAGLPGMTWIAVLIAAGVLIKNVR